MRRNFIEKPKAAFGAQQCESIEPSELSPQGLLALRDIVFDDVFELKIGKTIY